MKHEIKVVCFDLDKTLIEGNSWVKLNTAMGITPEEDLQMLKDYQAGNLSYTDWQRKILSLYRERNDISRANIRKVISGYTLRKGAKPLIDNLKEKGYKLALVSGATDLLVEQVANDLGFDYWEAMNTFIFDASGDLMSIKHEPDEYIWKREALERACVNLACEVSECAVVADGDNDSEMFKITQKGITFPESPIQELAWRVADNLISVQDIL